MLFTQPVFFVFLIVVFTAYWKLAGLGTRTQNGILLAASYVFYSWWDYRFTSLLILSTAIDYTVARLLDASSSARTRRVLLGASLLSNLGILFLFKYYGFFSESFVGLLATLGLEADFPTLQIILPLGISFYTFQTLSYTIDVYRREIPVCRDLLAFATYVAFFPQLVAGPIERAARLLPQILFQRSFSMPMATDGFHQMLWGFFKKIAIADSVAPIVNTTFANAEQLDSLQLLLGLLLFALQIYGDFSGYSDIAIGTAKLFGFSLMINFRTPYFSTSIADFWRRWHISLSTWFRDYIYFPLGGSRTSVRNQIRNILVVFFVSGIWHGASWNFIVWGAIHGLAFVPLFFFHRRWNDTKNNRKTSHLSAVLGWLFTMALVTLAWTFFRAENLSSAIAYLQGISKFRITASSIAFSREASIIGLATIILFVYEWVNRNKDHGLSELPKTFLARIAILFPPFYLTTISWGSQGVEFIYFQF